MRRVAIALLSFLVPDAAAQKAYVAPTSETVTSKLEISQGTRVGHELWVTNLSTVSITVTGVRLTGCQNIKQFCSAHKLNVKVPPAGRRRVFRMERDSEVQTSTFRYSYSWSAESTSTAALTAMAQSGSTGASERLAAMRHAEEVRRRDVGFADLELYATDVAALGDRIVSLRAEPDSFVVPMDSVLFITQLRVLALDSLGQSLGRFRAGFRFRVDPGVVRFAPPDTVVPVTAGRTVITVSPTADVNRARAKPLDPVQFTIIVPP